MITFERKHYDATNNLLNDTQSFPSIDYAREFMENLFQSNDEVARIEETTFDNGRTGIQVKDRVNKIIYQIKTT